MARHRSFEEPAVLSGAMQAFRRAGFGGVSVKDLEAATGLSAGSLYHAFGDKDGLFDAAFDHYVQTVLGRRIATHAGQSKGLLGVRKLFTSLLHEPGGESHGCLITNSAIEFGAGSDARKSAVNAAFEMLRGALHERLTQAQEAGVLSQGIEPAAAAVKLLAFYQGLLVLYRAGYDKQALKQAIDFEFDSLERT